VSGVVRSTLAPVTGVVPGTVVPQVKVIAGTLSSPQLPTAGSRVSASSPRPSLVAQATSGLVASQNPTGALGQVTPAPGSPVVITSPPASPYQPLHRPPGSLHIAAPGPLPVPGRGGFATFEAPGLLTTVDARDLSLLRMLITRAREGAPGPQAPVANPSGVPPVTGAFGSGGAAASGGMGFFFFGIAALLSLAFLLMSRVSWNLRATALPIAPQPFISLLERPG
jgi:hypothetical protein